MAFGSNTGRTPQGEMVAMPIGGTAFKHTGTLDPGQTVSTGWIDHSGYAGLFYIIQADVSGTISAIEYSSDKVKVTTSGSARTYDQAPQMVRVALAPADNYCRLSFTNGSTKQSFFYFEVKLSTTLIQSTFTTGNVRTTLTSLFNLVKGFLEVPNAVGDFDVVHRTGNSLNTNVTNFPDIQKVTLPDTQKVVVQFPAEQSVKVNNLPAEQTIKGKGTNGEVPVSVQFPIEQGVKVNNWPLTQPISGNVGINGTVPVSVQFPANQPVTVGNWPSSQSVAVSNFPATQPVSGNVGITGTPSVTIGASFIGYVPLTFNYTTGVQAIRSTVGFFGGVIATNTGKTDAYIQFFDTTGAVTLGTTPATWVLPLTFGMPLIFPTPINVTAGLKFAVTSTYNGTVIVPQVITFLHRDK